MPIFWHVKCQNWHLTFIKWSPRTSVFLLSEIIHSGALVKDAKIQPNSIVISQLLSVKNALAIQHLTTLLKKFLVTLSMEVLATLQKNTLAILSIKTLANLSQDVFFHLTLWIQCQIGHARFIHKQGKLCNDKNKYLKIKFSKLNENGESENQFELNTLAVLMSS